MIAPSKKPAKPDPVGTNVRDFLRHQRPGRAQVAEFWESLVITPPVAIGVTVILLVLLVGGYAIGGGFREKTDAVPTDTEAAAAELVDTRTALVAAQDEAAVLEAEVVALTADSETLRASAERSRLEMTLVVTIYEECVQQSDPAACVAGARDRADAFLNELFPASG